jgi:hypothetical protein
MMMFVSNKYLPLIGVYLLTVLFYCFTHQLNILRWYRTLNALCTEWHPQLVTISNKPSQQNLHIVGEIFNNGSDAN